MKPYQMPVPPVGTEGKKKSEISGKLLEEYKAWLKQCGPWLRDLRIAAGIIHPDPSAEGRRWEFEEAARTIGVSRHSWEKWERGVNPISKGPVEFFCLKTGLDIKKWCGWESYYPRVINKTKAAMKIEANAIRQYLKTLESDIKEI